MLDTAALSAPRWRGTSLLGVGLLVLAQALFWLTLAAAERAVRPANMEARPYVEFVLTDETGLPLPHGQQFRAPYRPAPNYAVQLEAAAPAARFEIPFTLQAPAEDYALYLAVSRSLQEVRLNGDIVQPNVPLDGFSGSAGWQPAFYMLPRTSLRAGENVITALVESEGYAHVFPEFAVASASEVAAAYEWGVMLNVGLPTAGVSILLFAGLLCLVVNWPREDRPRMRALIVLLLVWAIRDFSLVFSPFFAMPMPIFWIVYWTISFAIVFSAGRYVLIDTRMPTRSWRWLESAWAASLLLCVAMPLLGGRLGPDPATWARLMTSIELSLTFIVCGGALVLLTSDVARTSPGRAMERLALMICLTALMVDAADSSFQLTIPWAPDLPLTFYAAPICGLVLGFGMCAALAAQAGEARHVVVSANEILRTRLQEREQALRQSHEREKSILHRQALLEERQRIVRDMHDGIGGQLVGLILQVRNRALDTAGVERALEAAVTDLRLIVDALTASQDSLAAALRALEHRVRPHVEAAGLALIVQHHLGDDSAPQGPRTTLQIMRIMQEAITNALRHSGASTLSISARREGGATIIDIADDGAGMQGEKGEGRGLANMLSRASAIGAKLSILDAAPGTLVRLEAPDARD